MADLFPYRGTFEPPVLPSSVSACMSSTPVPRIPSTALEPPDEILDVLDESLLLHIMVVIVTFLFDGRIILLLMMLGSLSKNSFQCCKKRFQYVRGLGAHNA